MQTPQEGCGFTHQSAINSSRTPPSPPPPRKHNPPSSLTPHNFGDPAAGPYTGAALNPARVIGPALVFDCFWDTAFLYIFGQLLGGFLAAVLVLPLYGFGQFGSMFDTRILGFLGLRVPHRFQQVCSNERSP